MREDIKRYLAKQNHIADGMDSKGRRERAFYLILSVILFVPGAFAMWEFICELCNIIGSISSGDPARGVVQLTRMLPLILTAWIYVYLGIWLHHAYIAPDEAKRISIWRVHGFVTMGLGAIVVGYVIAGLVTGTYARVVEGYISPLFPLDIMIGGFLFIAYGMFAVRYADVITVRHSRLPGMPVKHIGPLRVLGRIPCMLSYVVALCSFAACVYGTYSMDWSHRWQIFNIMLWLVYFLAFAQVVLYRLVYVELKSSLKAEAMRKLSVWVLIVNAAVFVLYLCTVQLFNEAPGQNAFGILPVEYTASFNAFMPIFFANNIIGPLAAFLKSLVLKLRKA